MKIIHPGNEEKKGRREVKCPHCEAWLEITRADYEHRIPSIDYDSPPAPLTTHWVRCPECGHFIVIKPESKSE